MDFARFWFGCQSFKGPNWKLGWFWTSDKASTRLVPFHFPRQTYLWPMVRGVHLSIGVARKFSAAHVWPEFSFVWGTCHCRLWSALLLTSGSFPTRWCCVDYIGICRHKHDISALFWNRDRFSGAHKYEMIFNEELSQWWETPKKIHWQQSRWISKPSSGSTTRSPKWSFWHVMVHIHWLFVLMKNTGCFWIAFIHVNNSGIVWARFAHLPQSNARILERPSMEF